MLSNKNLQVFEATSTTPCGGWNTLCMKENDGGSGSQTRLASCHQSPTHAGNTLRHRLKRKPSPILPQLPCRINDPWLTHVPDIRACNDGIREGDRASQEPSPIAQCRTVERGRSRGTQLGECPGRARLPTRRGQAKEEGGKFLEKGQQTWNAYQ